MSSFSISSVVVNACSEVKSRLSKVSKPTLVIGAALTAISAYYLPGMADACVGCFLNEPSCGECMDQTAPFGVAVALGGVFTARNSLKNGFNAIRNKMAERGRQIELKKQKEIESKRRINLDAIKEFIEKGNWESARKLIDQAVPAISTDDFFMLVKEVPQMDYLILTNLAAPWSKKQNWGAENFTQILSSIDVTNPVEAKKVLNISTWAVEWAHLLEIKQEAHPVLDELFADLRTRKSQLDKPRDPLDFTLPSNRFAQSDEKSISQYEYVYKELLRVQVLTRPEVQALIEAFKKAGFYGKESALAFAKAIGRIENSDPVTLEEIKFETDLLKSIQSLKECCKKLGVAQASQLKEKFFVKGGAFDPTKTKVAEKRIQKTSFDKLLATYELDPELYPVLPEKATNKDRAEIYYKSFVNWKVVEFLYSHSTKKTDYYALKENYQSFKEKGVPKTAQIESFSQFLAKQSFNDFIKSQNLQYDVKEFEDYKKQQQKKLPFLEGLLYKGPSDWWSPHIKT